MKPLWRSLLDRFSRSPLASLSDVSAEGLKIRASLWTANDYQDPEDHVKTALLSAAYDIEEIEKAFAALLEFDGNDGPALRTTLEFLFDGLPQSTPEHLADTATILLVNQYPDDGGSTATHLESAAERIARYLQCQQDIAELAKAPHPNPAAVRAVAARALQIEAPRPTHEAPTMRQ